MHHAQAEVFTPHPGVVAFTGVWTQASHVLCSEGPGVSQGRLQAWHTFKAVMFLPHEMMPVLLYWPQLLTGMHWQL